MITFILSLTKCRRKHVFWKIAADGWDKLEFSSRSERYETHAEISGASQDLEKHESIKVVNISHLQVLTSFDSPRHEDSLF